MAPNGNCTGVCWHANRRSPFCNRRCKVLVFHGCASSQAGKRAFGLLLLQASHQVKYRQQRLVCWSYFKIMTEALLWRRWNHLKRCTMNGYINCELLKTYTTSRSTRCGWSKHTREHAWTRRHVMTHVLNERSHSTWSVRMVNGNCGAADRR